LKITTEPLGNRQLLLTIQVDEERTQQAMRQVARRIAKEVRIPGFRKGKAPYDRIVQRYGEDTLRKEAADMLVQDVYREALEEEGIESYAAGVLDEVILNPLTFEFIVPLHPTVDLGDYRSFRLTYPRVEPRREEIRLALERMRQENAVLEPVERPAALHDVAVIDLVGRTDKGEVFFKDDNVHVLLDARNSYLAPGFAEAIVGMEVGEERTLVLTLPDDFPREDLRGEEAEFTVTLVELYERILPDLDDDLARTVGNFDSLAELRQHVEQQLRQAARERADREYTEQVLEAIIRRARIEYPPVMLEQELDEVVKEIEQAVKREERLSLDDYLRIRGRTMEELREELKPQAEARLKRALVLSEVIRLEGLEVSEEEIGAHIEKIGALWRGQADEVRSSLNSDKGRQAVRSHLLAQKAVQRLVAIAKGDMEEAGSSKQEAEK